MQLYYYRLKTHCRFWNFSIKYCKNIPNMSNIFFCVAHSALLQTFWFVATLFMQSSPEYAWGDNVKQLLMGFVPQRAAGPWFKVLRGNLLESGQLNPEQSWRETLVTLSVTSQRSVSFQTICPTSEGSLNREGRHAHCDDGRRARVLCLSRPELRRRTRKRLKLQKMGQRRRREDDRSVGAGWHAGTIM